LNLLRRVLAGNVRTNAKPSISVIDIPTHVRRFDQFCRSFDHIGGCAARVIRRSRIED
jgi:hypothetical protein